jgi:hypothetical protein
MNPEIERLVRTATIALLSAFAPENAYEHFKCIAWAKNRWLEAERQQDPHTDG